MRRFSTVLAAALLASLLAICLSLGWGHWSVSYFDLAPGETWVSDSENYPREITNISSSTIKIDLQSLDGSWKFFQLCPRKVRINLVAYRPPRLYLPYSRAIIYGQNTEEITLGWFAACSALRQFGFDLERNNYNLLVKYTGAHLYVVDLLLIGQSNAVRTYARWMGLSYEEYVALNQEYGGEFQQARNYYHSTWILTSMRRTQMMGPPIVVPG